MPFSVHQSGFAAVSFRSASPSFVGSPSPATGSAAANPASTGRNFLEILRSLDSLQLTSGYSVATPADWQDGDDVIVLASMSDEDAKAKFPKRFVAKKPYLRVTPQPNRP